MYTNGSGRASVIAILCLFSFIARAVAGPQEVSVPSGNLEDAVESLAKQYGVDVIYASEDLRGLTTPGLNGNLESREAFRRLLEGTGLAMKAEGNAVLISRKGLKATDATPIADPLGNLAAAGADSASHPGLLRQAQSDTPANSADLSTAESDSGESPDASDFCRRHPRDASCKSKKFDMALIPEIMVKGSRSLNGDIRRTVDDPQPYVVFDSATIQRSQATNLNEFLRSRLPMSSVPASGAQATIGSSNKSQINLRGLGDNKTLILVDGRRLPVASYAGQEGQPDINGIPLASIERIEILPSTASGIYGGGATGGVVNIIRRHDYQGLDVKVGYGNTFDSAVGNERVDLNGGFGLGDTQITFSASHAQAGRLTIGERDFSRRAVALQQRNFPEVFDPTSSAAASNFFPGIPQGATVNILSANGDLLMLKPQYGGTSLGKLNTHVPVGYRGAALDGIAALIANAGTYNLANAPGPNGLDRELLVTPKVDSVSLNVQREFTPWLKGFIDGAADWNRGTGTYSSLQPSTTLDASAPNNPFQQAIIVTFPQQTAIYRTSDLFTNWQGTAGLVARLPRDWTANLDYTLSRSREKLYGNATTLSSVGNCVLTFGVAAGVDHPNDGFPPTPCGAPGDKRPAIDVLQDAIAHPIDFSPYLEPQFGNGSFPSNLRDITLRSSGPVWNLPGGPITLSASLEDREDTLKPNLYFNTVESGTYTYFPESSRTAHSFYLEAVSPLTHRLELQTSVRHDEYATRSPSVTAYSDLTSPDNLPSSTYYTNRLKSTDYTVALRFAPVRDVALRASFGTGFLPASVQQLIPAFNTFAGSDYGIKDPRRGGGLVGTTGVVTYSLGGNPDLRPELSKSASWGLILTPRFAPGLRVSIDYTRTSSADEIGYAPGPDFFFKYENQYPGRIKRGPKLPGDPANFLGPVIFLDTSAINIARAKEASYDINAEYKVGSERIGDLRWFVIATTQRYNTQQAFPGDAVVDIVGYVNEPLSWAGNMGLDWNRGPLYAQWNAQYYHAYRIYDAYEPDDQRAFEVHGQGSTTIPSQLYHDVLVGYRYDAAGHGASRLFGHTEISFGIQNVFNQHPPIVSSVQPNSVGYSAYGDPRLRRYSLTFRKSFGVSGN